MKVLLCFALVFVAQVMSRSAIPGHLRDWSQIREKWASVEDSDWVHPTLHRNPPILRTLSPRAVSDVCGKKNPASNERIVSGTEATPNEFPWAVGLFTSTGFFCTGTLISDQHVLTAAHCLDDPVPEYVDVYLGTHNVRLTATQDGRLEDRATKLDVHPNWRPALLTGDLGVITLSKKYDITGNKIRPLCLQPSSDQDDKVGSTAQLAGWGKVSDTSSGISPTLQKATATVISNSVCSNTYGATITNNTICTEVKPSGTCSGDSGGALAIQNANGIYEQYGITSFVSSSGCESGKPDGFTRIRNYLSWITGITGPLI